MPSARSLRLPCALAIPLLFTAPGDLLASPPPVPAAAEAPAATMGIIQGVVRDHTTKEPIKDAIVVLQCACLQGTREVRTNVRGIYLFRDLPPGNYTIQVLSGQADMSKVVALPRGAKFRANFSVNPRNEFKRTILVESAPVGNTSRDFTSAISVSPTYSVDSGRIRNPRKSAISGHALRQQEPSNREGYAHVKETEFQSVRDAPLSTFSVDVDTAAYSNIRRFINDGRKPPADAVRTEEMLNYFTYEYSPPNHRHPMSATVEFGDCPWNKNHWLAHVGVRTADLPKGELAPRNLVFLIDVSGSMNSSAKLPLVKDSLRMLAQRLRPQDRIALVVYAGSSGLVLPSTSGANKHTVLDAIDRLEAGGSTNGAGGIQQAYKVASSAFIKGGTNRVILATDGDFNVGATSHGALTRLIERKRKSGVYLSVLGFGTGNYQDATMELLADKGNGNYAYIDNVKEARKVLVDEADATLVPVADDVKLQIEFNPRWIASYRLIGYENRRLADRDFDDDTKDAGELGAGHSVTALYEIVPTRKGKQAAREVGPLRYQSDRALTKASNSSELARVKIRYKHPGKRKSVRVDFIADLSNRRPASKASRNFRWSAAVAAWSMLLRGSKFAKNISYQQTLQLARGAVGPDPHGYRREFVQLVERSREYRLGMR